MSKLMFEFTALPGRSMFLRLDYDLEWVMLHEVGYRRLASDREQPECARDVA